MQATFSRGVSRRELYIFFYKYQRRLVVAFLLPFLLCLAISFIPVPRYKAQSVLVVRLGAEYVYQPEEGSLGNAIAPIPFDRDQIFKSEVAILASDSLHAQLMQMMGIENLYPDIVHPSDFSRVMAQIKHLLTFGMAALEPEREEDKAQWRTMEAVERFDKRFDILLQKDSAVITLTFEHRDHVLAAKTLATLLDLYFQKRKELYLTPRAELAQSEMQARTAPC